MAFVGPTGTTGDRNELTRLTFGQRSFVAGGDDPPAVTLAGARRLLRVAYSMRAAEAVRGDSSRRYSPKRAAVALSALAPTGRVNRVWVLAEDLGARGQIDLIEAFTSANGDAWQCFPAMIRPRDFVRPTQSGRAPTSS